MFRDLFKETQKISEKWDSVQVCPECYEEMEPGRNPIRLKPEHGELTKCAKCGKETASGIYYRMQVEEDKTDSTFGGKTGIDNKDGDMHEPKEVDEDNADVIARGGGSPQARWADQCCKGGDCPVCNPEDEEEEDIDEVERGFGTGDEEQAPRDLEDNRHG